MQRRKGAVDSGLVVKVRANITSVKDLTTVRTELNCHCLQLGNLFELNRDYLEFLSICFERTRLSSLRRPELNCSVSAERLLISRGFH